MISRKLVAAAMAGALATIAGSARAYCPSYGTSAGCAVEPSPGQNPDPLTFRQYFDKVGTGSFTADEGPALDPIKAGCDKPKPTTTVPPEFPCHVLYGIAQQESDWTHFCVPESPTSAVGKPERTIVSFDCGYGIAQVTSGMHDGDTPDFDQARVAADPLYNMIVGLQILRSKWEAVQCVGDREPEVVEDWYSALWAYNGLSYKNNPNNPTYSAGRGVYQPANGGSYPYQEKVLGWMEFPKSGRWGSIQPGYPNRGEIGTTGTPKALTEPKCGTPTSCTKTRTRNLSACTKPASPDVDAGSTVDAGPPAIVDAGIAVQLEAKGEADEGCSCRAAAAPARAGAATTRTGLAFLFFVLAAFGIRRGARSARRARSAPRSARR